MSTYFYKKNAINLSSEGSNVTIITYRFAARFTVRRGARVRASAACRRPAQRRGVVPSGAVRGATLQKRANRAASETRRSTAVG